jgi:ppGpp synthetase/RelA/SpoT-type nucleotidyltranferase
LNSYYDLEGKLSGVLDTLESILREKLDNFGFYYRMFSRIKTGNSIVRKLETERYQKNPDKKIKDLFGIRIVLYYQDDIEVCKKILEDMMINIRWKKSESDTNTFDATKDNGTFILPGFVQSVVLPEIENLRIDPTFEIQIRTVFFEGWHEAEHDMRYKDKQIWEDFPKESRKLNSVLATLEMCDQYMVSLFDDMGHDFYKKENWGQMIRYKYRLKTLNGDLDDNLEQFITGEIAKRIFKMDKKDFIDMVLESGFNRLDANIIVYLINEKFHGTDDYVQEIHDEFLKIRHAGAKRIEGNGERSIVLLKNEKAFEVKAELDCKEKSAADTFADCLELIYSVWLKREVGDYFPDIFTEEVHPVSFRRQGITVKFKYDMNELKMRVMLSHVGVDAIGKTWTVTIEIWAERDKLLMLCNNIFARPKTAGTEITPYNRPKVYKDIAKQIGIKDVWRLQPDIVDLQEMEEEAFYHFLENDRRNMPVLLITFPNETEKRQYDSCYGHIVDYTRNPKLPEQNNLMRKIGFVCHVFCTTGQQAARIASKLGENPEDFGNGVRFFAKGFRFGDLSNYRSFSEKEIFQKPKDIYALRTKKPYFYQTVSGADAVRHEVIQMVYSHILQA